MAERASPGIDPALLLEHGEWLRRLARALARGRDDAEAEDLVQETWLAALKQPPDADRPVRPWLGEVLRNLWRMRRRGESRRGARETEAAATARSDHDATPGADVLLERAVALQLVSTLLVELPDPLRTTVLLRYSEGLSAARIAELEGVPAGTVRWRLKAALDRLREGMDARAGGGASRWRRAVLAPGAAGSGGSTTAFSLGAWTMKQWTLAAFVVLALVGAGVLHWSRSGTGDATARTPGGAATDASRGTATAAPGGTALAPGAARVAAGAPAGADGATALADPGQPAVAVDDPAPLGVFEGRVINWSTGQGVAGAELAFTLAGGDTGSGTLTVATDAQGRFELSPPAVGAAVLTTGTAAGFLPYAPEWGQSPVRLVGRPGRRVRGVTVFLFPAIDYQGVVVDPDGKPVAGASVRLYGAPQGEQALDGPADRFTTDAQGRFTFHAPDDAVLEARAGGLGPGRARLDGNVAISHRLEIRLGAAGTGESLGKQRLAGRVVDGSGAPVAGALVRALPVPPARPEGGKPAAKPTAPGVPAPPVFDVSDDEGRFELAGLDAIDYELGASEDGHPPVRVRTRPGRADVRLVLAGGGALAGRVLDGAGTPVPSFTVLVLEASGLSRRLVTSRSVVDADGRFELPHLAPGDYRVLAAARGFAPSGEVRAQVPERGVATVEVRVPRGGSVTGVVSGSHADPAKPDTPLPWVRVMLEAPGGGATISPANAGTVTDETGRFILTGVPPGVATISIGAGGHHPRLVGGLEVADGQVVGPLAVTLRPLAEGETPQLELTGIGVKVAPGEDALLIEAVIDGGGAAAAGLLAGDQIVTVDGRAVAELGFEASLARIRGPEGTRVRLGVARAGTRSEIVVERRKLRA